MALATDINPAVELFTAEVFPEMDPPMQLLRYQMMKCQINFPSTQLADSEFSAIVHLE
jgi:hypothetical protein